MADMRRGYATACTAKTDVAEDGDRLAKTDGRYSTRLPMMADATSCTAKTDGARDTEAKRKVGAFDVVDIFIYKGTMMKLGSACSAQTILAHGMV